MDGRPGQVDEVGLVLGGLALPLGVGEEVLDQVDVGQVVLDGDVGVADLPLRADLFQLSSECGAQLGVAEVLLCSG